MPCIPSLVCTVHRNPDNSVILLALHWLKARAASKNARLWGMLCTSQSASKRKLLPACVVSGFCAAASVLRRFTYTNRWRQGHALERESEREREIEREREGMESSSMLEGFLSKIPSSSFSRVLSFVRGPLQIGGLVFWCPL